MAHGTWESRPAERISSDRGAGLNTACVLLPIL
jgi:hypothetical protein